MAHIIIRVGNLHLGCKSVTGSSSGTCNATQPHPTTKTFLAGNIPTTKKERERGIDPKEKSRRSNEPLLLYTHKGSAGSNSHRNSNSFQDLSPGFSGLGHTSKSSNGDGRPSIGTITEQWEFMRINFVNNSDEVIA